MCGNDQIEGTEVCDGTDLGTEDCVGRGFDYGTLLCLGTCDGYDDSGCGNEPTCDTGNPECTDGDPASCVCLGCNDDGQCDSADDDCVCADCVNDNYCGNAANCQDDGICRPFWESCLCADCADHSLCQP